MDADPDLALGKKLSDWFQQNQGPRVMLSAGTYHVRADPPQRCLLTITTRIGTCIAPGESGAFEPDDPTVVLFLEPSEGGSVFFDPRRILRTEFGSGVDGLSIFWEQSAYMNFMVCDSRRLKRHGRQHLFNGYRP